MQVVLILSAIIAAGLLAYLIYFLFRGEEL